MVAQSKLIYFEEEYNKPFQYSLPIIPNGTYDTALYNASVQDKKYKNMWVSPGIDGIHTLEFLGKPPKDGYYFEGELLGRVDFPTFTAAYEFIKANKLNCYQLRDGCYKEEIEEYNKRTGKNGRY